MQRPTSTVNLLAHSRSDFGLHRGVESRNGTARGVGAAVLAAALFGVIFYVSGVIDASAEVVFGWRIVLTLVCYALALLLPGARALLRSAWAAMTRKPWLPLLFLLLCAVMGVQLWLFSWAPLHGHALDASLGFLLLPLVLVLGGRIVLRAEVTRGQWVAVGIAVVAVAIKVALTPQVSWVTFVICLGYPTYFVLRRRFGLDGPMAFALEVAVLTPVAALLIVTGAEHPSGAAGGFALLIVGIAGAGAMAAYLAASRLLSLPLFGLLGYLEPVALVAVALILGEQMHGADLIAYAMLALALTVLAAEGYRTTRRQPVPIPASWPKGTSPRLRPHRAPMNPEPARQGVHPDPLRAGCSHSVHFLVRELCSRSFLWFR